MGVGAGAAVRGHALVGLHRRGDALARRLVFVHGEGRELAVGEHSRRGPGGEGLQRGAGYLRLLGEDLRHDSGAELALAGAGAEAREALHGFDVAVPLGDRLTDVVEGDVLARADEALAHAASWPTKAAAARPARAPWRAASSGVQGPATSPQAKTPGTRVAPEGSVTTEKPP